MKALFKTLSWRTVGVVEMLAVVLFTTGHLSAAAGVAALSFFVKGALYYGHEVAWERAWKAA